MTIFSGKALSQKLERNLCTDKRGFCRIAKNGECLVEKGSGQFIKRGECVRI